MISIQGAKQKCKDNISLIENYEQAVNDKSQMWVCHHRLEISLDGKNELHRYKDLIRLGMYYKRPYFELIFLPQSEHMSLHLNTIEARKRRSKVHTGLKHSNTTKNKMKKPKSNSDFGKKYFEHYGYSFSFNKKQYSRECQWYHTHGSCSWEE